MSSPVDVTASNSDSDVVLIDHDDVSNYNPDQILPQPPKVLCAIRAWLQPTAYDIAGGEYRKHLASRAPGTGAWLTASATYQQWLHGAEHGLLWIRGIPGSGKSVVAASLVDELSRASPGCPVLFFFFRQIIDANHAPEALLRDWLDQLLRYSPPLQQKLAEYVEEKTPLDSLSMEDLWKDLRSAMACLPGKVFCVGDALDEMGRGHDDFLKVLGAMGQWRPDKVKFLITSRPVPAVETPLRKVSCLRLRLVENLVDVDISTYVRFTLFRSKIPQSEWKTIEDAVPGRANGLFLYAKLAMDAFLEPGARVDDVLAHLPLDLNALYTNLIAEHARRSGVEPAMQRLILQSVTHATRPLRLLELAEMIRVHGPQDPPRDLKTTKNLIRAACGPLLEILPDETVSVVHHSFTEYLKGTTRAGDTSGYPVLQKGSAHADLALACIRYLQSGCLYRVNTKPICSLDPWGRGKNFPREDAVPRDEVQLRLRYPFFQYATSNWHCHAVSSEAAGYYQQETNMGLQKFLGCDKLVKAWLRFRWADDDRKDVSQLHIAARVGLVSYTKELLATTEVDILDGDGKTPLWWAAYEGQTQAVLELIAAGADPDKDDATHGYKPLHMAAKKNRHGVVKALLEAGVDPLTPKTREQPGSRVASAPKTIGDTPLMYACENGHLESVDTFLPYLKDIEAVHRALSRAAEHGRSTVVARILRHPGVDVNLTVGSAPPLYLACRVADLESVRVLIEAGADPNPPSQADTDGSAEGGQSRRPSNNRVVETSLHQLTGPGHKNKSVEPEVHRGIVSLLVQAGVDIHRRDGDGRTALHGAVKLSPVLTRLLLDAGADADAVDKSGHTPLHMAESVDAVALLVEQGSADINHTTNHGQTPLHSMLSNRNAYKASLKLLEYGPDCDALDKGGNTALHTSLRTSGTSNAHLSEALLKAGVNPNVRNRGGLTPLLKLDFSDVFFTRQMDLLLDAGADINAVDNQGATLLLRLLSSGLSFHKTRSVESVKMLLDRGAAPSARDFGGRTILHRVLERHITGDIYPDSVVERIKRLDFVLSLGVDHKVVDYHGNGLLHEIAHCQKCHHPSDARSATNLWERIVALGLNPNQRNHSGRTPLHIICLDLEDDKSVEGNAVMPVDLAISRAETLDVGDKDGITPLHLAVTNSRFYTKRLLDAGADPTVATNEGLTPLHLAARCRESNIVGMLLEALWKRQGSPDTAEVGGSGAPSWDVATARPPVPVPGVNAKVPGSREPLTPLYYACRSGRPETVALLLEAGADATEGNIFKACAGFEEEDGLWWDPLPSEDGPQNGDGVALRLEDRSRPGTKVKDCRMRTGELHGNETTRLPEILDMLVESGADISLLHNGEDGKTLIEMATDSGNAYTAACLRSAQAIDRGGAAVSEHTTVAPAYLKHIYRNKKNDKALASPEELKNLDLAKPGEVNQGIVCGLLIRRDYHRVEELARRGTSFLDLNTKNYSHNSNLSILIEHGLSALVDKVLSVEAASQPEKADRHADGGLSRANLYLRGRTIPDNISYDNVAVPFIVTAVKCDLPNMDVVRVLVEKFGADVNDRPCNKNRDIDGQYHYLPDESALHNVAQGNAWWHVHQALPYLLKIGADVNIRDKHGRTPLHWALTAWENPIELRAPGPFSREAAEMLMDAGADVNAVDEKGFSCLACAKDDTDMIELLMARGATVTADALLAAVNARNVPGLRALLSSGISANTCRRRRPDEDHDDDATPGHLHEFPLYQAMERASFSSYDTYGLPYQRNVEEDLQIIQLLLDHGADPFERLHTCKFGNTEPSDRYATPTTDVPDGYRETTILHELFRKRYNVGVFLEIPGLDVNRRDADGLTLLLAACQGEKCLDGIVGSYPSRSDGKHGTMTMFQKLLSLGADVGARDNFGRNVIHRITDYYINIYKKSRYTASLETILTMAPYILEHADAEGKTPLHYAISRAELYPKAELAEALLPAGPNVHAADANGDTPLHVLANSLNTPGKCALFEELVKRGADVNARNALGETPLFAFSTRVPFRPRTEAEKEFPRKGALPMLERLGVDFHARDNRGRGVLHAAARGSVERFKELMDLGLDVMLEDDAQQTAIDVAAACDNRDVLHLFEKGD